MLLASSVYGLFKRRQFEPEVILLAVRLVPALIPAVLLLLSWFRLQCSLQ
jgi:hypothetical protein